MTVQGWAASSGLDNWVIMWYEITQCHLSSPSCPPSDTVGTLTSWTAAVRDENSQNLRNKTRMKVTKSAFIPKCLIHIKFSSNVAICVIDCFSVETSHICMEKKRTAFYCQVCLSIKFKELPMTFKELTWIQGAQLTLRQGQLLKVKFTHKMKILLWSTTSSSSTMR